MITLTVCYFVLLLHFDVFVEERAWGGECSRISSKSNCKRNKSHSCKRCANKKAHAVSVCVCSLLDITKRYYNVSLVNYWESERKRENSTVCVCVSYQGSPCAHFIQITSIYVERINTRNNSKPQSRFETNDICPCCTNISSFCAHRHTNTYKSIIICAIFLLRERANNS